MVMSEQEKKPEIDIQAAHKHFSAQCFNKTWDLIMKSDRTSEQDDEMLALTMASFWHWTEREDYAPCNASVGLWQISRVFALLEQPENSKRFAKRSLKVTIGTDVGPFYVGYAYEALARAESIAGDMVKTKEYLDHAYKLADTVEDKESKKWLLDDLATIHREE
jgi:hypothetical protein